MISALLKKSWVQMRRIIPDVTFIHFQPTHHHLSIEIRIYSILFCDGSCYVPLKLLGITLKHATVKDLAIDWELPRKEWLIISLNITSLSSKMLLTMRKKKSFLLRISSVNVPNPQFTEKIHDGKVHFLCSGISFLRMSLSRKNAII